MAFYTSNIKTEYLEPNVFASKNMAEYRLSQNKVYLTNMRLLRINYDTLNYSYSRCAGAMDFIKTIELFDGNRRLSRLDNARDVYSFKRYNNTNDFNIGFTGMDKTALGLIYTHKLADGVADGQIIPTENQKDTGDTGDTESTLDLSMMLNFLLQAQILPTSIFKDLRLVITYRDYESVFNSALPPLLGVDSLLNEEIGNSLVKNFKGFEWTEIEHDHILLNGISQGDLSNNEVRKQSINAQLKGFDNKMVGRCFVQKQPTTDDVITHVGKNGSLFQVRESLQVRKNGSNLYPSTGLDSPAKINSELHNVWGEFNKPLLCVEYGDLIDKQQLGSSYLGFDLNGSRTNELQLQYERSVLKDDDSTWTSQALNMFVYGEVKKLLVVENGKYRIIYQ